MSNLVPTTTFAPPVRKPTLKLSDEKAKEITHMASRLPEDVDSWAGADDLLNDELIELMEQFKVGRTRKQFRTLLKAAGAPKELIDNFFNAG